MSVQYGAFARIVGFKPRSHQFSRNGTILRGIVRPIEAAFYKDWLFEKATRGPIHDEDIDKRKLARTREQGLGKGKRVDAQISKAFVVMQEQKLSLTQFLALRKLKPKKRSAAAAHAIHLSQTLLSNTRALFESWAKRGLKLIACQLPVGDSTKGLGTAIDCVLQDKSGLIYLVNVKTHAFKSYDRHTGKNLAAPYHFIVDSIRSQNQLQLLMELILFKRTYPDYKACAEIQCIDATGVVRKYELQEWAIKGQDAFWNAL